MSDKESEFWKGWQDGPPRNKQWLQHRKDEELAERALRPTYLTIAVSKRKRYESEHLGRFAITDGGDCVFKEKHIAIGGDPSKLNLKQWLMFTAVLSAGSLIEKDLQGEITADFWNSHQEAIEQRGILFSNHFYAQRFNLSIDPKLAAIAQAHISQYTEAGQYFHVALSALNEYSAAVVRKKRETEARPRSYKWRSTGTSLIEGSHLVLPDAKHNRVIFERNFQTLSFDRQLRLANLLLVGSSVSSLISNDFALSPDTFAHVLQTS